MLSDEEMDAIAERAVKGWMTDEEFESGDYPSTPEVVSRAYDDVRRLWAEAHGWRDALNKLRFAVRNNRI
jgi:hypothetical protein